MPAGGGTADVFAFKGQGSATMSAGAFERQSEFGAAPGAGEIDANRIDGQFQPPLAVLTGGLDETGLGHPGKAWSGWKAKGNPTVCPASVGRWAGSGI